MLCLKTGGDFFNVIENINPPKFWGTGTQHYFCSGTLLEKEPERVRLEPKILYEGGSLDPMKNRIFIEVAGKYVQTSFHLCESCPKTSMARLIKVKNAVRHSLVSHSKVHEKSKISKNPITKHFSSKNQYRIDISIYYF